MILIALTCFGFGIPHAGATQFVPLSIEEIAAASKLVIHGTVISKTTLRDEIGRIYTRVEVDVTEVWKGSIAGNRFTIALIGGVLGDERVTAIGQADYAVGEEVVAFLALNPRGEGVTIGLAHGKFTVHAEPGTGRKLVRSQFHGGQSLPQPGSTRSSDRIPLTLDSLKLRVRNSK